MTRNKITKKIYLGKQDVVPMMFASGVPPVNMLLYIAGGALQMELSLLSR